MTKELQNEIVIYQSDDGRINLDVKLEDETIWLTQKQMAELFGVKTPAINKHLNNIYNEGELDKNSTISILEIVQKEGNRNVSRNTAFYNLDAIISVGYRVNSSRATQFRIWATSTLKQYLVQGYAINEKVLKEKQEHIAFQTGIKELPQAVSCTF